MSDTSQGKGWWQAQDGKWYPPRMSVAQINAPEPFLFTIGDIGVSPSWIVTPQGNVPIVEADITAVNHTITTRKTPGWVIALVVIFIWVFFLSLLLLIIKEDRVTGSVMVTVSGAGVYFVSHQGAGSPQQSMDLFRKVDQTKAMIQQAKMAR